MEILFIDLITKRKYFCIFSCALAAWIRKAGKQGGDTPYTKARRFLSTCERGHLELCSIARVIILRENYLNLQRK